MSFDSRPPPSMPNSGGAGKADPRMQQFVQEMQALQQITESVGRVTEICWDTCDITPKDRLDGRSETCLNNCVHRYFDVANFIGQRMMSKLQSHE